MPNNLAPDTEGSLGPASMLRKWPSGIETLLRVFMSLADQATVSGVRFATSVLIARCSGNEELGIYSIAFGFLLIATCIQDALVSAPFTLFHAQKTGAKGRRYQGSVLAQVAMLGIIASLCFAGTWGIGRWLGNSAGFNTALGALAISTPFVLLREFARRVELSRLRISTALCIDAVSGCLQLLFLGLLFRMNLLNAGSVYLVMAVSCAIPAFGWLGIAFRGSRFHLPSIANGAQRHWSMGRWPFFAQIVGVLHVQGVVWIVGWKLGAATAGLFVACNQVVSFINPITLGVSNSLSPIAVHTYLSSGVSRVRVLIGYAMAGMGVAVTIFSIAIYWYSDSILEVIYGDASFQGHGQLMLLLGINVMLSVVHMMNDQGVWAVECAQWLLHSTLATVFVTSILAVPFVLKWGLNGAALSLILGRVVGLSYQSYKFFRAPLGSSQDSLLNKQGLSE